MLRVGYCGRYWCPACVRKACCPRLSQRVTSQYLDPVVAVDSASADLTPPSPVVLLLKQLPPNCSTIVVACQPSSADVISGSGVVGRTDAAPCCEDCGRSASSRAAGTAAMMMTPRHGRRRNGSGCSMSARASPMPGYHRRASGPRSATAAYFSPFVRRRTGSDGTCATCIAASSLGSSSCSVALDAGGPHPDGPYTGEPHSDGPHRSGFPLGGPHPGKPYAGGAYTEGPHPDGPHRGGLPPGGPHPGGADSRPARRSWFRHVGVGDLAWRVRRRDTVAVYNDRCSAASDSVRIMPSAPSLSRLPPSYSSICVTSWTQQQLPQPPSGPRAAPSSSFSVQTELKTIERKSLEDI